MAKQIGLMIGLGGIALGFLGASALSCHTGKAQTPAPSVEITSEAMRVRTAHLHQPKAVPPVYGASIPLDTAGPASNQTAEGRDFTQMKFNVPAWVAPTLTKAPAGVPPPKGRYRLPAMPPPNNVGSGESSLTKSWDKPTKGGKAASSRADSVIGVS